MNLPASVTISSSVMSRQLGDEFVLLDLASGNYYGLDAVGARIWALLVEGRSPQEVESRLRDEYTVDADALRADLQRLIGDLLDKGLLSAG
jgi:hypothetical protein